MAADLFFLPFRPALDANGIVVPGAKLYFYDTSTTTPRSVYSDYPLTTPLSNPVQANAAGVWPSIYLDSAYTYRVVLKTSGGVTLDDQDPYSSGNVGIVTLDGDDLAGAGGAGLIGFDRRLLAAPYISKTVGDRLSKVVYASDHDVLPDGTDQTTKFQAMIDSGASKIVLPATQSGSVYRVSGTLTAASQIHICGQNRWGTIIKSDDLNSPIIAADGKDHFSLSDVSLQYNGTATLGGSALYINNSYFCNIRGLWVAGGYDGVLISGSGSGNHEIVGLRVFGYGRSGVRVENAIDINLTNFRMSANDSVLGNDAGIALYGGVEAFSASQGDITLGSGHAISTAGISASTARGSSPWYNKFSQVYCDATKSSPLYLRQASHSTFVDCWFASAGHDAAVGWASALDVPGIEIAFCQHIKFIGGEAYGNGGYGAILYSGSPYITFDGMTFKRNRFSRPSNGPGIQVLAGATDFAVRNCIFERDADTTTYRMSGAVDVAAGASDRYHLSDNLLGGTSVSDSGTGVNKRVSNNY